MGEEDELPVDEVVVGNLVNIVVDVHSCKSTATGNRKEQKK